MKTALRTYHPVPSLQKTDGNAQDAPRIKNCLKAALLLSELKAPPPSTPDEVLLKLVSEDTQLNRRSNTYPKKRAGHHPPTSVVNLIFVLANHAAVSLTIVVKFLPLIVTSFPKPLSAVHFDGSLNFLDLFLPNTHIASASRGRAFLWLLYHYLESENSPNPFDDQYSLRHPGRVPFLRPLSSTDYSRENIDTSQEIQWGNMMSGQRNLFLQKLVSTTDLDKRPKVNTPHFVTGVFISFILFAPEFTEIALPEVGNNPSQKLQDSRRDEKFLFYVPGRETHPPEPSEPRRKCSYTTAFSR